MEIIKNFYVIIWDPNRSVFEKYDVLLYFINCYKETKKKNRPKTFNDFRKFIESKSLYMYWARCEYEILLTDWPCQTCTEKVDIHWQIMHNLDLITQLLILNVIKSPNTIK